MILTIVSDTNPTPLPLSVYNAMMIIISQPKICVLEELNCQKLISVKICLLILKNVSHVSKGILLLVMDTDVLP